MLFDPSFSARVAFFAAVGGTSLAAGGCDQGQPKCPPETPCASPRDGGESNAEGSHHADVSGAHDAAADDDGNRVDQTPASSIDAAVDAHPAVDVCSSGSSGGSCRDVDCSCSAGDAGWPRYGAVSRECFCDRPGTCPDYDTARTHCQPAETALLTYPSCNLEIIRFRYDLYSPGTSYVYDATTHALVGGSYGSDTSIGTCEGLPIIGRSMGAFPSADCPFGAIKLLCRPDAGD
jgi:hypothetical protein